MGFFLRGNAEWFVNVFSEIRERYPAYQIAIFKITAPALRLSSRIFVLEYAKTEKIKLHIFSGDPT